MEFILFHCSCFKNNSFFSKLILKQNFRKIGHRSPCQTGGRHEKNVSSFWGLSNENNMTYQCQITKGLNNSGNTKRKMMDMVSVSNKWTLVQSFIFCKSHPTFRQQSPSSSAYKSPLRLKYHIKCLSNGLLDHHK